MFSLRKNQQKTQGKSKLIERRVKEDRRSFKPTPQFPIKDNYGRWIKKDRRVQPDRRIGNIEVSYNPFGVSE